MDEKTGPVAYREAEALGLIDELKKTKATGKGRERR